MALIDMLLLLIGIVWLSVIAIVIVMCWAAARADESDVCASAADDYPSRVTAAPGAAGVGRSGLGGVVAQDTAGLAQQATVFHSPGATTVGANAGSVSLGLSFQEQSRVADEQRGFEHQQTAVDRGAAPSDARPAAADARRCPARADRPTDRGGPTDRGAGTRGARSATGS